MLIADMDSLGIAKAFLLQGPFYGNHNDYVSKAINIYPGRLFGAAYMDPWDSQATENFEKIVASTYFNAVKIECSENYGLLMLHPDAKLNDVKIRWCGKDLKRLAWY